MQYLFLLLLACSLVAPVRAQQTLPALRDTVRDEQLRSLLQERQRLINNYRQQQRQNSALFGGKSKRDLSTIIETLKDIIRKDDAVVRRIRELNYQQIREVESEQIGTKREQIFQEYQLKSEIEGLNSRLKRAQNEVTQLQAAVAKERSRRSSLQSIVALLSLALIASLIGVFVMYRRHRATAS